MKNKQFTFEIKLAAVPHTKETAEKIYGKGAWNGKFPIHSHASELAFTALNDAYTGSLMREMRHLGECMCSIEDMTKRQKQYHAYLQAKTRVAKQLVDSLKFVRME